MSDRKEGGAFRTFKSTSPVTSVAQEQPGDQTRKFLEQVLGIETGI